VSAYGDSAAGAISDIEFLSYSGPEAASVDCTYVDPGPSISKTAKQWFAGGVFESGSKGEFTVVRDNGAEKCI
jgi:hypothetical protein